MRSSWQTTELWIPCSFTPQLSSLLNRLCLRCYDFLNAKLKKLTPSSNIYGCHIKKKTDARGRYLSVPVRTPPNVIWLKHISSHFLSVHFLSVALSHVVFDFVFLFNSSFTDRVFVDSFFFFLQDEFLIKSIFFVTTFGGKNGSVYTDLWVKYFNVD